MSKPIITIIGKSNSGRTTLVEKLVVELKVRGYRIATIKHHSHAGFDIDMPGKDSWRFAQAGSDQVIISSPDKIASYRRLQQELTLEEILPMVTDVDLILAEGYKLANLPAIEIVRAERSDQLFPDVDNLIAVVSDVKFDLQVPLFGLDDVHGLADLIQREFLHLF